MFISCDRVKQSVVDTYLEDLSEGLQSLDTRTVLNKSLDEYDINLPLRLAFIGSDRVIIIDGLSWTINLVHVNGTLITTNGSVGQGPGEVLQVNHLHTDDRFILLDDLRQARTIEYELINDKLILSRTINHGSNVNLTRVANYRANNEFFSLFRKVIDPLNHDFIFEFHKSDSIFNSSGLIHSFSNTNTISGSPMANTIPMSRRNWTLSNSIFLYNHSDSISATLVNLNTNELSTEILIESRKRPVLPINNRFIDSTVSSSNQRYSLKNAESLPQIQNIAYDQNNIYISFFYWGGDYSLILMMNLDTKLISKILTPKFFTMHDVRANKILGVVRDFIDPPRIVILQHE